MKRFLIALCLLQSSSVFAAPFQLYCEPDIPATSFLIHEAESQLKVHVIHHFGAKYAPMYNGMVTPNDLETLKPRAQATAKLPSDYEFAWPMEKCKFHDALRFECFTTEVEKEFNGVLVKPFAIHSAVIDKDDIAGKYREIELNLSMSVDGVETEISMQYPIANCTKVRL